MMNTPTVLITGALTGIGRATALAFAREGARIVVSGRHADKGKALVSELQELGAEATFIKSDVRHEDEVRTLLEETVSDSVVWTLQSTTRAQRASQVR
jgi:NAD(P)-dependent dehydrogenase (short-subunit alcohol dehydrogenase family)